MMSELTFHGIARVACKLLVEAENFDSAADASADSEEKRDASAENRNPRFVGC
jgi:hypothetical protein